MTDAIRAEGDTEPAAVGYAEASQSGRARPRWRTKRAVALSAALLISVVAAGSVYLALYRPGRLTGPTARQQVLDTAKAGAESVLSYAPETIDENLNAAKSGLTGDSPGCSPRRPPS